MGEGGALFDRAAYALVLEYLGTSCFFERGELQGCRLVERYRFAHSLFHAPILLLTYATYKPLISWGQRNVAKLTLCATSGKKIGGGLEVYIVLSTVLLLRSAGSLANARVGF
jgi:hypothetical protein